MWLITTANGLSWFDFAFSRATAEIKRLLPNYAGTLTSGFYAVYNLIGANRQRCWAHLTRDIRELHETHAVAHPDKILDDHLSTTSGFVSLCTMHLAKGLEFRAVAVMACDDVVIPLQSRIITASDASDLEEIYNTERHLLYVACTRARDVLLVTGVVPASEFLGDMGQNR